MADRMRVTLLGSGTCVPDRERFPCSALVQAAGRSILVDLGPGIIRQILACNVSVHEIDHLLLTHFHADHCADLAPFIFAAKYPCPLRTRQLTLSAGEGIREFYERLNRAYGKTLDMPEELFEIQSLAPEGTAELKGTHIRIQWAKPDHQPESRGFRLTDITGFSVVFSGDTAFSHALVKLAKGADILVCESSVPDGQAVPGHLTPSLAGRIAAQAGVKKLVLTHFYPECRGVDLMSQCRRSYDGPVVLANDLMTL